MLKRWLPVLLLLPSSIMAEPLDGVAAVVNDHVITQSELNKQVSTMRQQLAAQGENMPSEQALRKQVLQHLIDVDLQLQLAKKNNIAIEDAEIDKAIQEIAERNKLSFDQLKDILSRQGLSWNAYRENIRKEMTVIRVQQQAVGAEISISQRQIEEYLKTSAKDNKAQYAYHLRDMLIPVSDSPTPEELKKAEDKANSVIVALKNNYDFEQIAILASNDEFTLQEQDLGTRHLSELPELFAKHAANMQKGDVAGPIRAGNGFHLIKLIDIEGDAVKHQVKKTHVRHILIKSAGMIPVEAEKQAFNIYQQLKSGKDFASLAKHYSLDARSALKGGDLGWMSSGELAPEFEKAMDSLPLHHISKPVKTQFGWHIIEVLGRKEVDDTAAFQRQQAMQHLRQQKFLDAVNTWLQTTRTTAYIKIMDKTLA